MYFTKYDMTDTSAHNTRGTGGRPFNTSGIWELPPTYIFTYAYVESIREVRGADGYGTIIQEFKLISNWISTKAELKGCDHRTESNTDYDLSASAEESILPRWL